MSAVECRACDGEGHHGLDDDGCLYTCYACGGTGTMTVEAAAEWDEDNAPFCGPLQPVYRGEWDDEEEPRPLDPRSAAAAEAAVAAFWANAEATLDELMDDDVPF